MKNYINILSPKLADCFSGTQISQYLSEIFIDFSVELTEQARFENKSNFLKKNLLNLDDSQAFKTIIFLSTKIENYKTLDEIESVLNKMKQQFPQYNNEDSILNQDLVEETKHWLDGYPKALQEYLNAEQQYIDRKYDRNSLDNLRLSLELLIKDLSGVNKSIENQDYHALLKDLKSAKVSPQLRNMIKLLIDYYSVYQNEFVKHDSSVEETEIEVIFELTSTMMKFLIRELGNS
ncbi:hypothetical protein [Enterococcus faecium]|uniref:Uncharacterized protein n=1 Tax=Enterococcus faecium TaxID=1352 RepID=A0AAW8RMF1_ENTFC|nr:hypothetical protein [Enterococcus faecium]EGP5362808.1 hypothetical protein [Enterococcus faecium]EGP5512093.1 hypothetical protein [Enterococcus faecium]EGP5671237.1 hypothetical protein [Enterococcus faecium]EMF0410828.1 hypothetical protein [Enterococcus faecium]MDQ8281039.1 hypothetical protein [Enterococcus faecium]